MANTTSSENKYLPALIVMTSLFFMWGFLTSLNDILIPHLKALFVLNYAEAMLIQFVFFGAYFLISLPAGFILGKIGYKKGVVLALITAGVGCLIFYPAAGMRSYPVFLLALFVMASGITLLQVSANPYVAILGTSRTASSRLNFAQAVNSLGHTLAPYLGSLVILSTAVKTVEEIAKLSPGEMSVYHSAEAAAVQFPYLGLAAVLFILAALFAAFKLPDVVNDKNHIEGEGESHDDLHSSAWKYKHLYLGAIGIFLYVGAEVAIGSFLVNFFAEPYIAGLNESDAGKLVSFYWGGAMVGRFIGSALLRKIKPNYGLAFNAAAASLLVVSTITLSGKTAMVTILLVGFFNSIMFPTIFTLAINGLGKLTAQDSGILVMAIVGGAVIPLLQGILADNIGIHNAFILPALCYLYVIYYALKGSVPEFEKRNTI
jgi:FHS family L-fucose permease-like MFS transporter